MDASNFYLFVVVVLFLLAIFDLVVGVSNDAVNFLNSAIGSKVAKRQTIMIVASAGILIGAMTSGGMMEVARKGIFNPEHFYFQEVMVIFLAVMITDIILLDLFNTLALPTSTTVSIVFEILGASLALSIIKVMGDSLPMNYIFNTNNSSEGVIGYMNWKKAGEIISGILLSVVFAFSIGAIIQFFSRWLFSFNFTKKIKVIGPIWGGIALTALAFFLVYKGLGTMVKNADPENIKSWQLSLGVFLENVKGNLWLWVSYVYVACLAFLFILQALKINIFRFVVLFGTFSLAMAFAGNDLVNFVGVPIAGWQAWQAWSGSSVSPAEFSMASMQAKVATPYFLLVMAGVIMIITLWLSKKARSVTETEVNLGSQSDVDERFNSNPVARGLVRFTSSINNGLTKVLPDGVRNSIAKSFAPVKPIDEKSQPAFDLVRATVNLSVASVLIAIATNLKLPLSTTYVSFMVAMGTSLSDRAWGRESAVYRVAGVMSVIGGWFMTAVIAMTAAAIFATFMYFFGLPAIIILLVVVGLMIYRSSKFHGKSLLKKAAKEKLSDINFQSVEDSLEILTNRAKESLEQINSILENTIHGVLNEDAKKINIAESGLNEIKENYELVRSSLFKIIKTNDDAEEIASKAFVLTYDHIQEIIQSLQLIVESGGAFVRNNHKPLEQGQADSLLEIHDLLNEYLTYLQHVLEDGNFEVLATVEAKKKAILAKVSTLVDEQVKGVKAREYGLKNTSLYFAFLLEMKDLSAVSARFIKLFSRISQ